MTETVARKRSTAGRASGFALTLFLAVYVGALVISLAPRGTFTTPASLLSAGE